MYTVRSGLGLKLMVWHIHKGHRFINYNCTDTFQKLIIFKNKQPISCYAYILVIYNEIPIILQKNI